MASVPMNTARCWSTYWKLLGVGRMSRRVSWVRNAVCHCHEALNAEARPTSSQNFDALYAPRYFIAAKPSTELFGQYALRHASCWLWRRIRVTRAATKEVGSELFFSPASVDPQSTSSLTISPIVEKATIHWCAWGLFRSRSILSLLARSNWIQARPSSWRRWTSCGSRQEDDMKAAFVKGCEQV